MQAAVWMGKFHISRRWWNPTVDPEDSCSQSRVWIQSCDTNSVFLLCFQTVSPLETHDPPFFFFVRELLKCYSHDANMCTCRCRSSITQVTVAKCFGLGHPYLCSPLSYFTRPELQEFGQAEGFSVQSHIPKIVFRSHSFLDPVQYTLLKRKSHPHN